MYYVLYQDVAIGPFTNRMDAYSYMGKQNIDSRYYAVKSDQVMQQRHINVPLIDISPSVTE